MTWSLRRQIFDVIILAVFVFICGYLILYPKLSKPPTCTDNRQNGTETGVDCGGSCIKACFSQVDPISVLWSRAFRVVPGRYNAVAYLENKNANTAVDKINYRFRFADERNIYIGSREGSTSVPPAGKFAIFEPGIEVGNSVPIFVTFEFTETPMWLQVSKEKINQLKVLVSNIVITDEGAGPRLSATLKNNSLFTIPEVNVVVILYDASGNALSASRTYINELSAEETENIVFTWPEPWGGVAVAKEIIPIYNIFSARLK